MLIPGVARTPRSESLIRPAAVAMTLCLAGQIASAATSNSTTWRDEVTGVQQGAASRLPFSFKYDDQSSHDFLKSWKSETKQEKLDADRTREISRWTEPASRLRVTCETIRFADFPACEWLLHSEPRACPLSSAP